MERLLAYGRRMAQKWTSSDPTLGCRLETAIEQSSQDGEQFAAGRGVVDHLVDEQPTTLVVAVLASQSIFDQLVEDPRGHFRICTRIL